MSDLSVGQDELKKLYSYLKTPYTYNQFLDAMYRDSDGTKISTADFNDWLTTLGKTKGLYSGIMWKTASDFEDILKAIASKVPSGAMPTRRMVDSAFIDPKNFKPTLLDYAKILKTSTKQVATQAVKVATGGITIYIAIAIGLSLFTLLRSAPKGKRV